MAVTILILVAIALPVALLVLSLMGRKIGAFIGTIVHESGHALGALLTGGGVSKIIVTMDTGGYTVTTSELSLRGRLGNIVTTGSGYVAPPVLGAIAMTCLASGAPQAGLIALAVAGMVGLIFSRGILAPIFSLILLFSPTMALLLPHLGEVHRLGGLELSQDWVGYIVIIALTLLLFVEGFRAILIVYRIARDRKLGRAEHIDHNESIPDSLALSRAIPFTSEMFWVLYFMLITIIMGLVAGGGLVVLVLSLV